MKEFKRWNRKELISKAAKLTKTLASPGTKGAVPVPHERLNRQAPVCTLVAGITEADSTSTGSSRALFLQKIQLDRIHYSPALPNLDLIITPPVALPFNRSRPGSGRKWEKL